RRPRDSAGRRRRARRRDPAARGRRRPPPDDGRGGTPIRRSGVRPRRVGGSLSRHTRTRVSRGTGNGRRPPRHLTSVLGLPMSILFLLAPAAAAALLTYLLTPAAGRLALRLGAVDKPGPRKIHQR